MTHILTVDDSVSMRQMVAYTLRDAGFDVSEAGDGTEALAAAEQQSFDLVLALSPASQRRALDLTRFYHLDVEYWPILDPTGLGESREARLDSYRKTRDQIMNKLVSRFGPASV